MSSFKPEMGKVVASRRLYLVDSPETVFEVSVGEPQSFPDGQDFYCPIQIIGKSESRVFYGAGIDSMQALDLALNNLASYVNSLNRDFGGKVRWIDDDTKLGFTMIDGTKI